LDASPFRLDLDQHRKRAEALLAGRAASQNTNPQTSATQPTLLSVQQDIANELGLPDWAALERHVAAMERCRQDIQSATPPDADIPTLHLRCGSDIRSTLTEAGFVGDFLEYADPFCQGPVQRDAGWLDHRAEFLTVTYGAALKLDRAAIRAKLQDAEDRLHAAADRYDRIVLWFEHDTYDQLILARCLDCFAATPPKHLELISPAAFPGTARFIGLGQLPPEALRLLWPRRVSVSQAMVQSGCLIWNQLRATDPRPLADFARIDQTEQGRAVRRHCQELPSTTNGLSLTEHLILQLLSEAPSTAGQIYHRLMIEREPLPWMTDLMFRATINAMKRVSRPVFTHAGDWPREHLAITDLGRKVLSGVVDWRSLAPPPRWLGGVLLPGAGPCWRWDELTASIVYA
jgi:hypothetical protein